MPAIPGAPLPGERLRTLHGLAGYACGHTGSCCRAGWPIPVEAAPLAVLRRAEADGRLPAIPSDAWERGGILGHAPDASCVFHARAEPLGGCRVEHRLGAEALPYSCRQFPRVLLTDARGWHQSLSAWCGSAARLIVGTGLTEGSTPAEPLTSFLSFDHIEADPRVHLEALDAREAWPPLLMPGVLAGHDVYAFWESRLASDFLASVGQSTTTAAMLGSALCWTDVLRGWRSPEGSLATLARRPWRHPPSDRLFRHSLESGELKAALCEKLLKRVPDEWRPRWPAGLVDASINPTPVTRAEFERAVARYLGTRLMGSWVAYQGEGLRSVAASLVSAYGLVALALTNDGPGTVTLGRLTSAIRATDWLLLHLLDRDQWAHWCAEWEADADAAPLLALLGGAASVLDGLDWTPSQAS